MKILSACFALTILFCYEISAQGCSDAGFCTMSAMKPDQSYSKKIDFKLRSLELNYYYGTTTLTPKITVYTVDLAIGINAKTSFQVKLPYQTVTGNFGDNAGMGDISVSASRTVGKWNGYSIGATIGGKIPSGYGSDKASGKASTFGASGANPGDLPMYYQVSLGTYDVVAGASMINEKWLFATGIQIPIIHQNDNDFRWGKWPNYPGGEDYVKKYWLANNLKRGTDVMLRVERNWRFLNYNFSFGALPIYRITKDRRYDFTPGVEKMIKAPGSTGLALSVLGSAGYHFNVNNSIKLIYGLKLMDRENNPDGLTRHSVTSFSYIYRF
ncbi:MAG: hypothetical protein ABJL71_11525 [Cyclobacteriaceae bacterium]